MQILKSSSGVQTKELKIFLKILLFMNVFTQLFAQLPYTFINKDRNIHYGTAENVVVGPDGTIFVACFSGGLRAYIYNEMSFIRTAYIDDGGIIDSGYAMDVAVSPDGTTVFLANNREGLRAYAYDGSSFIQMAHIRSSGNALAVEVGSDGTVFLASTAGLEAYIYD